MRTSLLAALLLAPLACGADPPVVFPINEPLPGDDPSLFGGSGGDSGEAGAAGAPGCDGSNAEGIKVAPLDLYRYPPYAADGCVLLYLAPAEGGAELRRRDLSTGVEETLAPASEKPLRPALAGGTMAWEATEAGRQVIRVRKDGVTKTVAGAFAQATEPRAAEDAVVFTAWAGLDPSADTDVLLYRVDSGALEVVASGPGQQRFADVSPTHVAFSDFAEDPDGTFDDGSNDLADLTLLDRTTGVLSPRSLPGKQAFPLLGTAGLVVFLSWPKDPPEPKLTAYEILASGLEEGAAPRSLGKVEQAISLTARPSSRDGEVLWVTYQGGKAVLRRAKVSGEGTPETLEVVGSPTLFAPAAGGGYALSAARPSDQPDALPTLTVLPKGAP